jgi:putative ABC transport system permease protein
LVCLLCKVGGQLYQLASAMFKNYLKVAIRNLLQNKIYTLINLLGLAVGIASCILIVMFIRFELSYDTSFANHDRVYRMALERIYPNHSTYYSIVPHSFKDVVARDFPEIENAVNVFGLNDLPLVYRNELNEEIRFDESFMLATDSSFFQIFDFKVVKGNREKILSSANEIVVTLEFAHRWFGNEDPIGKVLLVGEQEFKVTGLMEDAPANSHFKFSALVSSVGFPFFQRENFIGFSSYTYFKLLPGTVPASVESKIPQLVDIYAAGQIERELGQSWNDYKQAGNGYRYFLQSLTSIHLSPQYMELQMKPTGNITSIYILICVAALILGIACINFMNLSTARSAERAREVGVRKVMGSHRNQLMWQFLTESFLLALVGMLLALIFAQVLVPSFNELADRQLYLTFDVSFFIGMAGVVVLVGLMAGLYPALVLSSINPIVVLKGKFTGNKKGKWIRNGLVIFQFWISVILIIGALVIQGQMKYMQEKSLGFDKDQLVVVERGFAIGPQKLRTYIEEIRRLPEVQEAAASFAVPGRENNYFGIQFRPEGSAELLTSKSMVVSDLLPETLGLELKEGRWFSEESNDSLHVILNETAVKVFGITHPVGSRLSNIQNNGEDENTELIFTVIGVVKDFNFISLRDEITPLVLQNSELFGGAGQYAVARIKSGNIPNALTAMEAKWKELSPDQTFRYTFLNESLAQQYKAEQQTGRMFTVFSALAIFVACIGLFALSAYITGLRIKEIGVRKVLGASVPDVVLLLAWDFTQKILVAFVLAVPVAWYIMDYWWLSNFAYRISITLGIAGIAGIFVLVIAWITVSFQTIKAATANPIHSLRSN